ncbi:MAG: hypothetical protein L0220_30910 [Acidobacteria bacterium]|nr:hypothetical protein [Acidobacteriota bacterium]
MEKPPGLMAVGISALERRWIETLVCRPFRAGIIFGVDATGGFSTG